MAHNVKRFYEQVGVEAREHGFSILLDDRPVRSPGRQIIVCPHQNFAQGLAKEWREQGEFIDPSTMPIMHFASGVTDNILLDPEAARGEILKYAHSDLLCYRATDPDELVQKQTSLWDPVFERFKREEDIEFKTGSGIQFVEQDAKDMERFRMLLAPLEGYELGTVHFATTLIGSAVLAVALAKGWLQPDAVWTIGHLDEDFQRKQWGTDEEEEKRQTLRYAEFMAATLTLSSRT